MGPCQGPDTLLDSCTTGFGWDMFIPGLIVDPESRVHGSSMEMSWASYSDSRATKVGVISGDTCCSTKKSPLVGICLQKAFVSLKEADG